MNVFRRCSWFPWPDKREPEMVANDKLREIYERDRSTSRAEGLGEVSGRSAGSFTRPKGPWHVHGA